MELKPYIVSGNKEISKTSSSKEHVDSSSSVRSSVVRCLDIRASRGTQEIRFNSKPSSDSVTRTIQKCTGFELTLRPSPPVTVGESCGVSTPIGTPVLLYSAESFQSSDSSLASLSSLIQNVVCSSHGTIMKPLSSAPDVSSSSATHSAQELVTPRASQASNGTLRRTAAAALPVLSSQLTAGKQVLIPFHISHMNYLNDVTKFTNMSSSLVPLITSTSTVRPVKPSVSLLQPMKQRHLSQLYHPWHSTAYENGSSSKPAIRLSYLSNTSGKSDFNIINTNSRKNPVRLPSTRGAPRLQTISCSKSEAIKCQPIILLEEHTSTSQLQTSVYTSNRFSTTSSTTITLASDYLPPENGATKTPRKKILTSLLSGKTQIHGKCLLTGQNSQDSQTIGHEATLCDKSPAYKALTSTSCASSTRGSERSEPSPSKMKRSNKNSVRLACSNCDLMFFSGTDLLVHKYERHGHVCGECDGRFLSFDRLNQHKENDHPAVMICSLCRFHTFNKQGLIDHQRLEHCLEMESSEDCTIANTEMMKASTQVILTTAIDGHLSKTHHTGNTLTPSSDNERSASSIASNNTNESSDLPMVSVNIAKIPDNLKDKNYKQGSSSSYSKGDSQLELKPAGSVFTPFSNEIIVRRNRSDVQPSSANFDSREHCKFGDLSGGAADRHFSESDEPKLVIDTDKCRRIRKNVGHKRKTRRKINLSDTKSEIELGQSFGKKTKAKRCLKGKRSQNPFNKHEVLNVETDLIGQDNNKDCNGINDSVEIFDIMTNTNRSLDFLRPDEFREINLKQSSAVLNEKNTIANNFKRKLSTSGSLDDGLANRCERELGNGGVIDKQLIVINSFSGRSFDANQTGLVPSAEPYGDSAEQSNIKSSAHCYSQRGNKLQQRISDSCANSISSSHAAGGERLLQTCHNIKQPLAPLRERHAQNSLPPKKRKIFALFGQCEIPHHQTRADSNFHDTDVKQQNTNSIKIQENAIQRKQSINEPFVTTLGRTISTTRSQSLLSQQQTDRRYPCPVSNCVASFSRKWNLDGHINKVHAKFATVTCSVPGCQQAFPSKRDLRQHVTVDHKGKSRKFQCSWPQCNKSFFARTHLRIHTLTHTGEKPVACDICDYRCRQRTALMWHMRKHEAFPHS